MPDINMNTGYGYTSNLYPDNQPHIQLNNPGRYQKYHVTCSIIDSIRLLQLQMVADAIDSQFGEKNVLIIPYLMAARFDRIMQPGDSFDLRVIAKIINSLGFKEVHLLDAHNPDVSFALINNAVMHDNRTLVQAYSEEDAVLIVPDAGAIKKSLNYPKWNLNIKEVIFCEKHRDLSNGRITLSISNPQKCKERNCVIIDDLCDGGGTFMAIADELKSMDIIPKTLTLIVTHGIFSKGYAALEKSFDKIIVSDSYRMWYNAKKIDVIKQFV